jgi:hypothetical protein
MTYKPSSEDIMQAKQFQWAWNERQQTRRCIWHVPNGGDRRPAEAAQLKAMGVVAGVSDMHFYWQSQLYIIENKVGSNTLSDAQIKYRDAMKAQGAIFYECRTLEKWKLIVDSILEGNPLPGE